MICPFDGDDLGVARNENYVLVEWRGRGRVVFSFSKKGDAITAHFAAGKESLRYVKQAINDMREWLFNQFKWCKMILVDIDKGRNGVIRLMEKCGFEHVRYHKTGVIYGSPRCHQ